MTSSPPDTGSPTDTGLTLLLSYRDAASAIDWLERALGFRTVLRHDVHGGVAHAELRRGAATVVVFDDAGAGYEHPAPRGEATGSGPYLSVPDEAAVDTAWAAATAAGAAGVWAPERTRWGNYRCRFRDPEGREWTVGVYRPGGDRSGGGGQR